MKKPPPQPNRAKFRKNKLSSQQVRAFRNTVYRHATSHERSFLWRNTQEPYKILVSEYMLQQTQAHRVAQKYEAFIKRFPDLGSLARAKLSSVMREWQGLGYNRRAKHLHQTARVIVKKHNSRVPQNADALVQLPGIGNYTAAAIQVFAFSKPAVMIETNIRSVFLDYFFSSKKSVHDFELLPLIEQTLDSSTPRKWYFGLMDYGWYLKKAHPNPSRKSLHHTTQSPFVGSNRQVRGAIIRELLKNPKQTAMHIAYSTGFALHRVNENLLQMRTEGLLEQQGKKFVVG